jgi:prepilin-type processing-associated H-X9-DG protein
MLFEDVGRPDWWSQGQFMGSRSSSGNEKWADPAHPILIEVDSHWDCTAGPKRYFNCNNSNEIYSFHAGNTAAHFLFADGSVRLIRDTIPPDTFRALYTKAGGEVVTTPD